MLSLVLSDSLTLDDSLALVEALVLADVLALVDALVLAEMLAEVLALVDALVLAEVLALVEALVLALEAGTTVADFSADIAKETFNAANFSIIQLANGFIGTNTQDLTDQINNGTRSVESSSRRVNIQQQTTSRGTK